MEEAYLRLSAAGVGKSDVGRHVKMWWPAGLFAKAVITGFDPSSSLPFGIRYMDGLEESVDFSKEAWHFVEEGESLL